MNTGPIPKLQTKKAKTFSQHHTATVILNGDKQLYQQFVRAVKWDWELEIETQTEEKFWDLKTLREREKEREEETERVLGSKIGKIC